MNKDTKELQEKIIDLKRTKGATLLVHNYQIPEIQDIADFLGDSLGLARRSKEVKENLVVLSGVKFMAETVKILSPDKKVLLPVLDAGCPLAEMIEPQDIIELKKQYPDAWVVSYVNTYAGVKALSDVCCTSANAVAVVKNIPAKRIIFVPDKNLGWWVQKNVPEKELIFSEGFCIVHEYFCLKDLEDARIFHPNAEIMVHPECRKEVIEAADCVLSTSGMLKRAKESPANKFIVGTEEGLIHRLRRENPSKMFFSLGNAKTCINMKKTTLEDVYQSLLKEKHSIELDSSIIKKSKKAIERMVSYV